MSSLSSLRPFSLIWMIYKQRYSLGIPPLLLWFPRTTLCPFPFAQNLALKRGSQDALARMSKTTPRRTVAPEKQWTPAQPCFPSRNTPLIGPPVSVPAEQIAIIAPRRRPMRLSSGVVWATHAAPSGIRPPEENPKRIEKTTWPAKLVILVQQKTSILVIMPRNARMLNLVVD